jgi:hypothetical protein
VFALRIVFRLFTVGGAIYATYVDCIVAVYFNDTIRKCNFEDGQKCYCSETKLQFQETFRVGDYDCDNAFTRQPEYLIANAVLTGCCGVVLLLNLVGMVWGGRELMAERAATELANATDTRIPTAVAVPL